MEIKVQITVKSEVGQPEVVREVARLERGSLRSETLGLSLAEARAILGGLEKTMAERQAAEFVAQGRRCPHCGRERACKGHHRIVFRTPFGKLQLDSPQLYGCPCGRQGPQSSSPLAELLAERTSPELAYLETKFAALVSYGLTIKLLEEVLPIGQDLSTRTIRRQVQQAAERLEAELAQGRDAFLKAIPPDENAPSKPAAPLVVGLDGCYVHAKGQRSRTEGWFEVIVGKGLPTKDRSSKCFGFVSRYDPTPKRRLFEWLKAQGLQSHQPVTFLSDGGDTVRELPRGMHPKSEHLLDWFHVTMRLTVMGRMAKGVRAAEACTSDLSLKLAAVVASSIPASLSRLTALAVAASIIGSWPDKARMASAVSRITVVLPTPGLPAMPVSCRFQCIYESARP